MFKSIIKAPQLSSGKSGIVSNNMFLRCKRALGITSEKFLREIPFTIHTFKHMYFSKVIRSKLKHLILILSLFLYLFFFKQELSNAISSSIEKFSNFLLLLFLLTKFLVNYWRLSLRLIFSFISSTLDSIIINMVTC